MSDRRNTASHVYPECSSKPARKDANEYKGLSEAAPQPAGVFPCFAFNLGEPPFLFREIDGGIGSPEDRLCNLKITIEIGARDVIFERHLERRGAMSLNANRQRHR